MEENVEIIGSNFSSIERLLLLFCVACPGIRPTNQPASHPLRVLAQSEHGTEILRRSIQSINRLEESQCYTEIPN